MTAQKLHQSLLAIAATLFAIASVQAEQSTIEPESAAKAIHEWSRNLQTFDNNRYTLLLTLSTEGCTSCCISSVNDALRGTSSIDANSLVVIATPLPREGLALRKQFITTNIAEDPHRTVLDVFHADAVHPDAFLVAPDGRVLLHQRDLQHDQIDSGTIAAAIHADIEARNASLIPLSKTALIETDDDLITDVHSLNFTPSNHRLRFLDGRQNSIYTYDAATGRMIDKIPADTSLSFYFRKPGDVAEYWASIARHYQPLVKYGAVVYPMSSDSLWILADMFTGYTIEVGKRNGHDTSVFWHKGPCMITLYRSHVVQVDQLPKSEYYSVAEALPLNNGIITNCWWEGSARHNSTDKELEDSSYSFLRIGREGKWLTPEVNTAQLESRLGHGIDTRYIGSMCVDSSGHLFYLDMHNRLFMEGQPTDGGLSYTILSAGGSLESGFGLEEKNTGSNPMGVADISCSGRELYVLLLNSGASDSLRQLTIQRYDQFGRFSGEKAVQTDSDEILSAKIIECGPDHMRIIVKQREARWKVWQLEYGTFDHSETIRNQ